MAAARPLQKLSGSRFSWLLLLFFACSLPLLHAKTSVVIGVSEALYEVAPDFPELLESYEAAGFSQTVRRSSSGVRQVHIKSLPGSLELSGHLPRNAAEQGRFLGPIEPLPEAALNEVRRLRATVQTQRRLVDLTLDWLSREIRYEGGSAPQTPVQVLERSAGNCVGMTRLAIAMLRTAGVPARSVHAFQLQVVSGAVQGGAFHRLLEVYYPGVGWVASDVGRTKHFLPADTLILAVEGQEMSREQSFVPKTPERPFYQAFHCLHHSNQLLPLDRQEWPPERDLFSSWSNGVPLSRAAILGRLLLPGKTPLQLTSIEPLKIIIDGRSGRLEAELAGDLFSVWGLLPGRYRVEAHSSAGSLRFEDLKILPRRLHQTALDLSPLVSPSSN